MSVQADSKRGENCRAVAVGMAVERFLDVFEARLHRDSVARQERALRRPAGEPFKRAETVHRRKLADSVHSGVKIERRNARAGIPNCGYTQPNLVPHLRERIGSHANASC
jgi:hypothetical protein